MGLSDHEIQRLREIDEFDILHHINNRIDQAGQVLGLAEDRVQFYRTCDQLIRFQLPIIRENGQIEQYTAYRVVHKTHRMPAKGGLRINRYNNSRDLEGIAIQNAFRAAIFDIPLGGSKGLIKINPYKFSEREIKNLVSRYTIELAKRNMIGPSIDLIGPVMGTSEREMNWIKDTYQNFFGQENVNSIAVTTGKSVSNFGIVGGLQAQSYGQVFALEYLLKQEHLQKKYKIADPEIKGKTFIVQSFGVVGYWTAKFLTEKGAKLIGVLEYEGGIYNENGIDPDALKQHMEQNNTIVSNFPEGDFIPNDGVIEKQCDIYIPCYIENHIHKENFNRLNCKIILEGCNHPITPQAGQGLRDKGVMVLPDIITNAGGVIASYFEWIKNLSHTNHGLLTRRWEQKSKILLLDVIKNTTGLNVDNLNSKQISELQGASEYQFVISGLEEYLATAIDICIEKSIQLNIPLRQACYVYALEKMHNHYEAVGIPFSK
ncbi:hypothetical protein PPERSA_00450 [Pseudocohnilembus persalinus]|uniref:Glutamate dehydrogenase n=1 Tax=Pseudocohnilembus persalinus TaxID=266149 RepID=A0A0V0R6W2_PSEPJ|nr:hypothetical protein PPERSA_00450 [Pseudocohnilembus persalinus]|eukprot:KRX10253.1 hypothetical protein PPERSA_00450 [Pseudocohnilembus persalinus]